VESVRFAQIFSSGAGYVPQAALPAWIFVFVLMAVSPLESKADALE
jgi:hypothetical protein